MRTSRSLLAAALALALAAPSARALPGMAALGGAGGGKAFTFGIGGGLAVPLSDAADAFKSGWNGLAYARFQMPGMPVGFGVNVSFSRLDLKDAAVSSYGAGAGGNGSLLGGVADVKLDVLRVGMIRPYIIAGLGAYNVKTEVTGVPGAGSQTDTRFGVNGGAGVTLQLGRMKAYAQGRLDNVFSEKGVIDTKNIQVVPVTLGVEF